ncbi:HDOD domain-containing protein [Aquisalimonas sp.]|uniref:HDOD domain-containing protein n=1 Tax=unclassified Aquisalimonas TaxID=2644645 RepID=UPI0025BE34BE|nr:HDOD domain-containing protein [Aquisalimonas sp.]
MQQRLEDWLSHLEKPYLPILPSSAAALARLAGPEGNNLGVRDLHPIIVRDPALAMNILRAANGHKHRHLDAQTTTPDQALLMLGQSRAMELAKGWPAIDSTLSASAAEKYRRALANAYHTARQAEHWAERRKDILPGEVYAAALARYAGEFALRADPDGQALMETMDELRERTGIRRREAEYVTLGFAAMDLAMGLNEAWRIPTLMMEYVLPENITSRRTLGIRLALELTSIGEHGWETTGMERLLEVLATYLATDTESAAETIPPISRQAAEEHPLQSPPAWLPLTRTQPQPEASVPARGMCLMPRHDVFQRLIEELEEDNLDRIRNELELRHERVDTYAPLLTLATRAVHHGLGMNRTIFFRLNKNADTLRPYLALGAETDPILLTTGLPAEGQWLMNHLPPGRKPARVTAGKPSPLRHKLKALGGVLFQADDYLIQAIRGPKGLVGVLFADRLGNECAMDDGAREAFHRVCVALEEALEKQ